MDSGGMRFWHGSSSFIEMRVFAVEDEVHQLQAVEEEAQAGEEGYERG